MNKKVKYSLEYKRDTKTWIIWKEIETERSINCGAVFRNPSKLECQKELERLRNVKSNYK